MSRSQFDQQWMLQHAVLSPMRVSPETSRPHLFLCHNHAGLTPSVVKFLPQNSDAMQQALFQRELAVLQHLQQQPQSFLMPLLSTGVGQLPEQWGGHEGQYYIMPYADGGNLAQRMHANIDKAQMLHLLQTMVNAVEQLHQCGWLHLDIKPSNFLLLDKQAQHFVLTDFALARAIDDKQQVSSVVQGTPSYMSPEQFQGGLLNQQTDYYALGLVCYELITGQHPFQAKTYYEWAFAHCQQPVPLLPEPWQAFQNWLDGLLAKDRTYRVKTLTDFNKI